LHPDVSDGSTEGLLAVHSLSKRSNLAGYRAGFVAGDPQLIGEFLEVRKHTGFMVPTTEAAMTAALADDEHVPSNARCTSARQAALAMPSRRRAHHRLQ
jgi:aspartate/methionine/tyrosine aminotransferase